MFFEGEAIQLVVRNMDFGQSWIVWDQILFLVLLYDW